MAMTLMVVTTAPITTATYNDDDDSPVGSLANIVEDKGDQKETFVV